MPTLQTKGSCYCSSYITMSAGLWILDLCTHRESERPVCISPKTPSVEMKMVISLWLVCELDHVGVQSSGGHIGDKGKKKPAVRKVFIWLIPVKQHSSLSALIKWSCDESLQSCLLTERKCQEMSPLKGNIQTGGISVVGYPVWYCQCKSYKTYSRV